VELQDTSVDNMLKKHKMTIDTYLYDVYIARLNYFSLDGPGKVLELPWK